MTTLLDEEFEQVFLDKWSHGNEKDNEGCEDAIKKDQASHHGIIFSNKHSLLQVYECLQDRAVIISINPSIKYNLIHIELAKSLKALANNICST